MKLSNRFTAISLLLACLFCFGCNSLQKAQDAERVVNGILTIARAEESALPAKDVAIIKPWVDLGFTLDGQLQTCNSAAGSGGKDAVFAGCFNAFATGLLNPTELAQLRLLSTTSQSKAALWATAIILGVNTALDVFGATQQPMPQVADVPPSHDDLVILAREARAPHGYGY